MKHNWRRVSLKEVCNKITDGSHNPPKRVEISDYLMLSSKNIFDDTIILDSPRFLTESDFKAEDRRTQVEVGDVLLTCVGTIGRVAVVNEGLPKFTLQRSVAVLKNKRDVIDSRFLMFSLQNILDELTENARGVAQKGLYLGQIQSLEIPIPTLNEQQRIVSILDDAFAGIARATANADKNLANARELFLSYLKSVFENKGEDWEMKRLGDIGKPSMCKRILKHQTSSTGDIPFYKIGTFGKTPDAFISKEKYHEFRTKYSFPKKGDILISASGTIGRRVRYDGEPAFFQDSNIVWIDNDEMQVLNDYLYVFYEFCDWQPSKGATISRLYNTNLISIKIVFPKSFNEQKRIVHKLDALSTETKRLEAIYQQKLNALEELKKSILNQAFSGKLQ